MEDGYRVHDIGRLLRGNPYVGRGIIVGRSADGGRACAAYFIMGRSANSRNRVLTLRDGVLFTEPLDPARVEDASLIIYAAMRQCGGRLIVSNGDQTDTILAGLRTGLSMAEALKARCFEPDAPSFTPRISAVLRFDGGNMDYELGILKSMDASGTACARYCFSYPSAPGLGHFIHTYMGDGKPLPSFQGEPERVRIPADIDELAGELWDALDAENRIAMYARYITLATGETEERLINKYGAEARP